MTISNKDSLWELFPLQICSLAATGDVWLELMRNVRWNGDPDGAGSSRGDSTALRFRRARRAAQALPRAG